MVAIEATIREPAGTRTQGPYIKSVLLYQLSYEFNPLLSLLFSARNGSAKITGFDIRTK
jgi:hypothetical protein